MHLKDGTSARPGDIVKKPDGQIGLIIGGSEQSDKCNLTLIVARDAAAVYCGPEALCGAMKDKNGVIVERCAVAFAFDTCVTASECERIAHADIGNG